MISAVFSQIKLMLNESLNVKQFLLIIYIIVQNTYINIYVYTYITNFLLQLIFFFCFSFLFFLNS